MPKPVEGDWRAEHWEAGQTFRGFLREKEKNLPVEGRNTIYLQPIGDFPDWAPKEHEMRTFTAAFFQLPTKVLPTIAIDQTITSRTHGPWGTQLLTTDILNGLKKGLPDDAFCVLGVTMTDLYPHPDWNFVFGQATFLERVGVFSFARHVPADPGLAPTAEDRKIMMLRSYKTLSHEIGHMFGIRHCTAYLCGMNGTNHQAESDRQPVNYCPVCLQKLQHATRFDIVSRYDDLIVVMGESQLREPSEFFRARRVWVEESDR